MKTGARLALYGAGLVVAFGGAFGLAALLVPGSLVEGWAESDSGAGHAGQDEHGVPGATESKVENMPQGLSLSAGGYTLAPIEAPMGVSEAGSLGFRIEDLSGEPLTEYATTHDRDLHLIVVRSDGTGFHHEHPDLDRASGTWSLPWTWSEAGSFRVYADFATGEGSQLTLSRTVEVAGEVTPAVLEPTRVSEVDGYTVALSGDLVAGASSELTLTVMRSVDPVTTLEPYLGAFGHLVALRQGDLAFLHVHPEGGEPSVDERGGPELVFAAEAPTAGRYLLYLDFQIDGEVHTASFVLDALPPDSSTDASHGGHAH